MTALAIFGLLSLIEIALQLGKIAEHLGVIRRAYINECGFIEPKIVKVWVTRKE